VIDSAPVTHLLAHEKQGRWSGEPGSVRDDRERRNQSRLRYSWENEFLEYFEKFANGLSNEFTDQQKVLPSLKTVWTIGKNATRILDFGGMSISTDYGSGRGGGDDGSTFRWLCQIRFLAP